MDAWDLNPCPHAYASSTLPNRSSPHPSRRDFLRNKHWAKYPKSSEADMWMRNNGELEGKLSLSQISSIQAKSIQMESTRRSKHRWGLIG